MWLLSPSQVSFQSVAAQQSPYLQHVQHLLQRINRCNNATLITHFCPIRVMRPHFCHNRPCQRTVLAPQDLQDGAAGRRISEVAAFQTFLVKVESQAKRLRQDCRNKATSPHSSLRKGSIQRDQWWMWWLWKLAKQQSPTRTHLSPHPIAQETICHFGPSIYLNKGAFQHRPAGLC